jgi:cysteinyl-tRNA synthetase
VRYWLHTGFLTVNGEKMAKSLGNFVTIKEMMKEADANAIRLFFALTHYRSPIDFSRESIAQAKASAEKIMNAIALLEENSLAGKAGGEAGEFAAKVKAEKERFVAAMEDDFDTPGAMAALFGLVKEANTYCNSGKADSKAAADALGILRELVGVIGLREQKLGSGSAKEEAALAKLKSDAALGVSEAKDLKTAVETLIVKRKDARAKKGYAASDAIRAALDSAGIVLEDTKEGVRWKLR